MVAVIYILLDLYIIAPLLVRTLPIWYITYYLTNLALKVSYIFSVSFLIVDR
jgi:hypothetical protein